MFISLNLEPPYNVKYKGGHKRFDKQTNSCKYLSPLALLLICSAPARVAYRRISIWRVIIDGCSLDSSLHTKPAGGGASNPDGGRRKNDSEWSGTCCWGVFFPMV